MKRLSTICISLFILMVFISLVCNSCLKEKKAKDVRLKQDRAITIVNNTGNRISGYQVNVASTGVEIEKGVSLNDSFSIIINESFVNDTEIEVVLVDIYDRVYAKTFNVPLNGNTDTPITADDRKSEGLLKDKWKDLTAWLNRNK